MKAYVYHLHLKEHSLYEGYVGVAIDVLQRLNEHKRININPHLTNAFNKYGDDIICSILLEGPEAYCYEIEKKLRSSENIGWNINEGGRGGFGYINSHPNQKEWTKQAGLKTSTEARREGGYTTSKKYPLSQAFIEARKTSPRFKGHRHKP